MGSPCTEPHTAVTHPPAPAQWVWGHSRTLKARRCDLNDWLEGDQGGSQADVAQRHPFCFIRVTGRTGIKTETLWFVEKGTPGRPWFACSHIYLNNTVCVNCGRISTTRLFTRESSVPVSDRNVLFSFLAFFSVDADCIFVVFLAEVVSASHPFAWGSFKQSSLTPWINILEGDWAIFFQRMFCFVVTERTSLFQPRFTKNHIRLHHQGLLLPLLLFKRLRHFKILQRIC